MEYYTLTFNFKKKLIIYIIKEQLKTMTEEYERHYIHVDSSKAHKDSKNNLYIKNQPIENVHRVGLLNFTTSNTSYNVKKYNRSLYWIEQSYYNPQRKVCKITLPVGYYDIESLANTIQIKANNLVTDMFGVTRSIDGKPIPQWTVTVDTDKFQISITTDNGSGIIADDISWIPFTSFWMKESSLWHSVLGFDLGQIYIHDRIPKDQAEIDAVVNLNYATLISSATSIPTDERTITGNHCYRENVSELVIASKELATNSYSTVSNSHETVTQRAHILQRIQVGVNRYSFIHYNASEGILWHPFHGTLAGFSLEILGQDLVQFENDEISSWTAVVVVETKKETANDFRIHEQLDREAYALEHRRV